MRHGQDGREDQPQEEGCDNCFEIHGGRCGQHHDAVGHHQCLGLINFVGILTIFNKE